MTSDADTHPDQPVDDLLTEENLSEAVRAVCQVDPDLDDLVQQFGPPPLWARPPGYTTLVQIILEQQVSMASAAAVFERATRTLGELTPATVRRLSVDDLRALGFTRQKASYCSGLAWEIDRGVLDLDALESLTDHEASSRLRAVRGIGAWTASIYLLMALRRPDIWPDGDLALVETVRRIKGLPDTADRAAIRRVSDRWSPWRSVAARILWHAYLENKRLAP